MCFDGIFYNNVEIIIFQATKPIKNEARKYLMSDVEDKISDLLKDVDTHVVTRFPLDKPENASPLHR